MNKLQHLIEAKKCYETYCKKCEIVTCREAHKDPRTWYYRGWKSKEAMHESFKCYCTKYIKGGK